MPAERFHRISIVFAILKRYISRSMLDKCASRQRVNRAGENSSKKRISILCTEKLALFLRHFGKADIRAFRVVRSSAEVSSVWIVSGSLQRRCSCRNACRIRQSRRYVILTDRTWAWLYPEARVTLSRTEASAIPSGERTSSSHSPA